MGKPTVMIGFPDGGSTSAMFTESLAKLVWYELSEPSAHYTLIGPPKHASSIYIQENRNDLVRKAQQAKADWLLQIDADESFEPTLLRQLMQTALQDPETIRPVVVGLYSNVANIGDIGDGSFDVVDCVYAETSNGAYRNVRPPENLQPFTVDAAGTGIFLTHMSVYETIGYPWYWCDLIQVTGKPAPQFMNEDLAFCRVLREHGYTIWCDPLAEVTHWKTIPLMPSTLRHFMAMRKKSELTMTGETDRS